MTPTILKVAILIVSTTAAKDPSTDASSKLLGDFFAASSNPESLMWEVAGTAIVSDDYESIQTVVKQWADTERYNLVVTTGGTGFAITDGTPEACWTLLEIQCCGCADHVRRQSNHCCTRRRRGLCKIFSFL